MSWTEAQQAMLREMGLRTWSPVALAADVAPVEEAAVPDERQARHRSLDDAQDTPEDESLRAASAAEARSFPARPSFARAPEGIDIGPRGEARRGVRSEGLDEPRNDVRNEVRSEARHDGVIIRAPALDWPELREAVAACRACALCETRRQTVFGVGRHNAHWMVVGEAPGEQEDRQGEPFVGAAGRLLDSMLRALKLTRSEEGDAPAAQRVYIANTLKCRPPGNRNPLPEELARCEPFLVRQIELVQPRIILAMGRFAVQALLRTTDAIGKLRGRVHRYQGVPLIVTYHPAYLLRNLPDKARAWEDLCLAAQVAEAAAREGDAAQ